MKNSIFLNKRWTIWSTELKLVIHIVDTSAYKQMQTRALYLCLHRRYRLTITACWIILVATVVGFYRCKQLMIVFADYICSYRIKIASILWKLNIEYLGSRKDAHEESSARKDAHGKLRTRKLAHGNKRTRKVAHGNLAHGNKRTRKVPHGNLAHGYFEYVVLSSCFHINKSQLNKKIASFIVEEFVSNINN